MSGLDITELLEGIKRIAENTVPFDVEKFDLTRSVIFLGDSNAYLLDDSILNDYSSLIETIVEEYGSKVSEKKARDDLDKIIVRLIEGDSEKRLRNDLAEMVLGYKSFKEVQRVFVPVAGLNLYVNSLTFGKVKLIRTSEALEKIQDARKAIKGTATDEAGAQVISMIEDGWKTNTCAQLEIIAEPEKAKELALHECRGILDLLTYAAASIYHIGWNIPQGLKVQMTEAFASTSAVVVVPSGRIVAGFTAKGPYGLFDINDQNIESMRKLGIFKIAPRMAEHQSTRDWKQITRAIHWFAESQRQDDEGNELLGLITCLEMFLTPEKGSEISVRQSVAEGAANVIGKDLDEQVEIKRFIKRMYDKRSDVVHGRKLQLTQTELAKLKAMVIFFMVEMTNGLDRNATDVEYPHHKP